MANWNFLVHRLPTRIKTHFNAEPSIICPGSSRYGRTSCRVASSLEDGLTVLDFFFFGPWCDLMFLCFTVDFSHFFLGIIVQISHCGLFFCVHFCFVFLNHSPPLHCPIFDVSSSSFFCNLRGYFGLLYQFMNRGRRTEALEGVYSDGWQVWRPLSLPSFSSSRWLVSVPDLWRWPCSSSTTVGW